MKQDTWPAASHEDIISVIGLEGLVSRYVTGSGLAFPFVLRWPHIIANECCNAPSSLPVMPTPGCHRFQTLQIYGIGNRRSAPEKKPKQGGDHPDMDRAANVHCM